jgi:hypothetical protein
VTEIDDDPFELPAQELKDGADLISRSGRTAPVALSFTSAATLQAASPLAAQAVLRSFASPL